MNEGWRRLGAAAAISLIVHLLLLLAGVLVAFDDEPSPDDAAYVEVSPVQHDVDPEEVTEEQQEEDEEYEPPSSVPGGQVVDAAEAGEERRLDGSGYLGARDQVVEQQTRSAIRLRGAEGVSAAPSGPQAAAPVMVPAQQRSPSVPSVEQQDLGLRPGDRGDVSPRQPPPAMPSDVDLEPSVAVLSDAIQGTGLDDLRDAEDGAETLLSTVHFLHAPFFQRVKHQVEQYWRPDRAMAQHDPGGHIYGYRDRETIVRVVLEADGALERAYVTQPSGADFLDDEAVGAIRQAAPFPNPPAGLVDERSHHIVFTFGFTVEMGEQPIVRLRRYGE